MKIAYLLAVLALTAGAQDAPKQLWAHVDFISIAEGKGAEFQKAVTEIVAPKYRERGADHAFLSYRRLFPHGSDSGPRDVCIGLAPSIRAAVVPQRTGVAPSGLARTQRGELWRVAHSANMDKLQNAPYVRALFLRHKEGRSISDTVSFYRDQVAGAAESWGASGLVVFSSMYTVSRAYSMVVLWGYQGIEQLEQSLNVNTPARQLLNTRLNSVRDVVRIELWQRTDLGQ